MSPLPILVVLVQCVLVVSGAVFPEACGLTFPHATHSHQIGKRVGGGTTTTSVEFPWIAMIFDKHRSNHYHRLVCHGVLLTPDMVLTVAHCLENYQDPSTLKVRAGVDHLFERGPHESHNISVRAVVRHPNFDINTDEDDIAILYLEEHLPFNDGIQPICLPDASHPLPAGSQCSVAGFGFRDFWRDFDLKKATLPVLSDSYCDAHFHHNYFPNINICGGSQGNIDLCMADDGVGLVKTYVDGRYYVYGLADWTYNCGRGNFPNVYVDVRYYRNWITQTVAMLQATDY